VVSGGEILFIPQYGDDVVVSGDTPPVQRRRVENGLISTGARQERMGVVTMDASRIEQLLVRAPAQGVLYLLHDLS
jgi:hypothetical protein